MMLFIVAGGRNAAEILLEILVDIVCVIKDPSVLFSVRGTGAEHLSRLLHMAVLWLSCFWAKCGSGGKNSEHS